LGLRPRNRIIGLFAPVALVLGLLLAAFAQGERTQYGTLVVSLGGQLEPLTLPREHPAPVAVNLEGSLQTSDGSPLPRVIRVELGLPQQGRLSFHGLPTCPRPKLVATSSTDALAICRAALVGHGRVDMTVQVPTQAPFEVHARLLAFNGRIGEAHRVLLHAYTPEPPFSVVLPFSLHHRSGRFGMALAANLPALGEWARVARFQMTLGRRYTYRGQSRSYLSASCPIPKRFTAGFFSFARIAYRLSDGRQVSTAIARSCRARQRPQQRS
jgi:hypothetical protein